MLVIFFWCLRFKEGRMSGDREGTITFTEVERLHDDIDVPKAVSISHGEMLLRGKFACFEPDAASRMRAAVSLWDTRRYMRLMVGHYPLLPFSGWSLGTTGYICTQTSGVTKCHSKLSTLSGNPSFHVNVPICFDIPTEGSKFNTLWPQLSGTYTISPSSCTNSKRCLFPNFARHNG